MEKRSQKGKTSLEVDGLGESFHCAKGKKGHRTVTGRARTGKTLVLKKRLRDNCRSVHFNMYTNICMCKKKDLWSYVIFITY